MALSSLLGVVNYGIVLLYGLLLTVGLSGGVKTKKEKQSIFLIFLVILATQTICWRFFGYDVTRKLYPLISHLPCYLALVFVLKKPRGISLVSVLTAYFCCQLPRWIGTIFLHFFGSNLYYQLGYMISLIPLYLLLKKYFVNAAHEAISYSKRSLHLFGILPLSYYIFDYATTVYTQVLYSGIRALSEFMPAAIALFYAMLVSAYHREVQKRSTIELHSAILSMQLEQSENNVSTLQQMQEQTATYRHDMRHHLAILNGYLMCGETEKALHYIQSAENDIAQITPKRYCENVSVNLILTAYAEKAKKLDIKLSTEVNIPASLQLSETELCALLSNGLENAVNAASACPPEARQIRINCQPHKGNLLIYISNSYTGEVQMKDGLPQNDNADHGFGSKSIKMIVERHNGYCSFEPMDGIFTLKVVLPADCCPCEAAIG